MLIPLKDEIKSLLDKMIVTEQTNTQLQNQCAVLEQQIIGLQSKVVQGVRYYEQIIKELCISLGLPPEGNNIAYLFYKGVYYRVTRYMDVKMSIEPFEVIGE
jgi:hypothetical protein